MLSGFRLLAVSISEASSSDVSFLRAIVRLADGARVDWMHHQLATERVNRCTIHQGAGEAAARACGHIEEATTQIVVHAGVRAASPQAETTHRAHWASGPRAERGGEALAPAASPFVALITTL